MISRGAKDEKTYFINGMQFGDRVYDDDDVSDQCRSVRHKT